VASGSNDCDPQRPGWAVGRPQPGPALPGTGPTCRLSAVTSTERTTKVSSSTPNATAKPSSVTNTSGRVASAANVPASTSPAEVITDGALSSTFPDCTSAPHGLRSQPLERRTILSSTERFMSSAPSCVAGHARAPVVRVSRRAVAVSADHPLADASLPRPADLRGTGLWFPASSSASELLGAYRRVADHLTGRTEGWLAYHAERDCCQSPTSPDCAATSREGRLGDHGDVHALTAERPIRPRCQVTEVRTGGSSGWGARAGHALGCQGSGSEPMGRSRGR
jgi:hypothetical protein